MTLPDDIVALKARLDAARPLAAASLAALERWYDVELTYASNAIEGSTLTRTETALVLDKGLTVGGKPLGDHLDALGHRDALGFIRALAARDEVLREGDVREIHRLVLFRSRPDEAGRYARHQRAILGSTLRLPPPSDLPALMGDLAGWSAAATPGPEAAFEAHYRLVTIHPFADGNGRTARLLMNLLLLKAGFPPVSIGPEDQLAYLDTLSIRQNTGEEAPWTAFTMDRLRAALRLYLDHLGAALA